MQNKKGNVCDEVISITAFVHFALAGTYFVAEMAFPEGNYFWGNNLPFFTGTIENNLLYLAELGIVYRILRKALGNRRQIPSLCGHHSWGLLTTTSFNSYI